MKKFIGVSIACLVFLNVQAKSNENSDENSNFSESSWSIQMTQNNGEPIQVQSEQKELNKHGVVIHRKSKGVIENGVYKPISEENLSDPSPQKLFESINSNDFEQNVPSVRVIRFPQDFQNIEEMQPPRRKFFKVKKPHVNRNFADNYSPKNHQEMTEGDLKDKINNRSRVSFYRPVENIVEKLFGIENSNEQKVQKPVAHSPINEEVTPTYVPEMNVPQTPHKKKVKRLSPRKKQWFKDMYRRQKALQEEMQAFYDNFFEEDERI